MDMHATVMAFHAIYAVPVAGAVAPLAPDRLSLRLKLIEEEYAELLDSSGFHRNEEGAIRPYDDGEQDVVEMADALGDIVYVCFGMAIEMGIDLNRVLAEIHRGNLSKLGADGKPIINDGLIDPSLPPGKVLKGPNYAPPQIAIVLAEQEPLS